MATTQTEPATRAGGAFRSRDFRLYQAARLLVIVGAEAQSIAVAWQVYQITHSALSLGYTGLALFLPGSSSCCRRGMWRTAMTSAQ